ncbi:MAG: NUDIX domain-containing protein [Spirochaetaceae bacterium]|jgi:ADP-ribose pyrophosphatase YjhB (NUDIX family)|nr:NUDIX domain-containing protein [Spirochaetaceae bacterium]
MFSHCPSCASQNIRFENNKRFFCPDCGFVYYHNTAAATGCVISTGKGVLFLIRGREPARGKLDLPGGFVDPGEGVTEGLRRECREELGWDPASVPGAGFSLFASFPNIYPYKGIVYNTCDIFFTLEAPELSEKDLRLEEDEIAGIRFIRPEDINYDDIAFDSARRAVRAYVERLHDHY